ncbi:MAG: tetratricopeptide repeat protein [Planctomycetes bacterium]|nr:tetratricopeptide repeat protein [Planctomycetota bacterium]
MAETLVRKGEIEDAIRHFRRSAELAPDAAQTHMRLGMVLAREGDLKEAEKCFRQVLRIEPKHAAAQENLRKIETTRQTRIDQTNQ